MFKCSCRLVVISANANSVLPYRSEFDHDSPYFTSASGESCFELNQPATEPRDFEFVVSNLCFTSSV